MTVNARSEMDLEEDSILGKVAKASGANFGYHKEKARPMPEQGPVVSGALHVSASPLQPPFPFVWYRDRCTRRQTQRQTSMPDPEMHSGPSRR